MLSHGTIEYFVLNTEHLHKFFELNQGAHEEQTESEVKRNVKKAQF